MIGLILLSAKIFFKKEMVWNLRIYLTTNQQMNFLKIKIFGKGVLMKPEYLCRNKICIISYKDSIDLHFCQNNCLIERQYISENDHFVLDFSKVSFIDSAGIGKLVATYRSLDSVSKSLCLINLNHNIKRVLRIAEIEHVFPIFDTLQDAQYYYKKETTGF